ncbi:MAG: T9SS type A sorting domain-containing protein, partial [Bacteroidia bacterium]
RPVVTANASPGTAICAGASLTLNGGGANSYSWTNSVTDGVPFTPSSTATYTVTGTGSNGCTNTATVSVTVNPLPNVSYTVAPDDSVCAGTAVTCSGTGASTYVWSNSLSDGVPFTPATSGSYVVTGTDVNGCSASDTVQLVVNANPVVNLGADITQVMPPVVLDAGAGYSSYLWSTSATTQTISVSTFGNFWVLVTDANGCTASDTILVTFTVGVSEALGNGSFSLYPNPSAGLLSLNLSNLVADDVVMNVADMNGRIVFSERIGSVNGTFSRAYDLSHLSAGSYVITLTASGSSSAQVWEKK